MPQCERQVLYHLLLDNAVGLTSSTFAKNAMFYPTFVRLSVSN